MFFVSLSQIGFCQTKANSLKVHLLIAELCSVLQIEKSIIELHHIIPKGTD